jgi:RHS repeat-associated protein
MIARVTSGGAQYFLSDRLSVRLVLDSSGNAAGRQGHLPFGDDFGESGTQEKHHFTTYERDGESGSDYALNRGYVANLGRFQQADPYKASGYVVDPQSWNRYSYARNKPIDRVDPLGLDDEDPPIILRGWDYYDRTLMNDPFAGTSVNGSRGDDIEIVVEPPSTGEGGGLTIIPLPGDLLERLRSLLTANNNQCGNFAQNLINQVADDTDNPLYADYILDLFEAISGSGGGGYVLRQAVVNGQNVGGTALGSFSNIGYPNATPPTVIISPIEFLSDFQSGQVTSWAYVIIALHETIHLAAAQGQYSDRELATAVSRLGGLSEAEMTEYKELDPNDITANSRFWNKFLKKNCR